MRHVKKGDEVMVLSGREKGKKGKVLRIFRQRGRAVVEKVNFVKRHLKPSPQAQQGGIVEKEASLDLSSLMLVCPRCSQAARTGIKKLEDKSQVRVCRKCGEVVDKK